NATVTGVQTCALPIFLELVDTVGCLPCMELRHAPVVQHLPAPHRVAEVDLPVVLRVHVPEGGGDAALGHHGVGLAEERLADEGGDRESVAEGKGCGSA